MKVRLLGLPDVIEAKRHSQLTPEELKDSFTQEQPWLWDGTEIFIPHPRPGYPNHYLYVFAEEVEIIEE